MKQLKLKVCGMRAPDNLQALDQIGPDFIGFIFYPKSTRYVSDFPDVTLEAQKVGVFVNETLEKVQEMAESCQLDLLQLHGSESVDYVRSLKEAGFRLIKVFSVTDSIPEAQMESYEPFVDFFLFDTKTPKYGGSGQKFNWEILKTYHLNKPFFLSGGIDLDDIAAIKALELPQLYAVDINSRFEQRPALKDIEKVKAFKELL
ncbi:phosphoribosylanthranilate isomerase [Marinoscillum furvescens]|uniref:N-(5'-phosphoribosyl)anthranilate isomerase n=1 Tax=Marinoscillum furvescens DSM 4134 TaxID=1122208 RepID=A0A3D9L3C2_MARFU|nr:phosphoribosylanthranilate isomerase [Marinoscillum furvescens]RED97460.1 phosphoribosylanthranilate isomerase [Marinoscillum furvescens DSM 4134]